MLFVDLSISLIKMFFYDLFQLRRIKTSDATLSGELMPYNIVPLEAPSSINPIAVFPEVIKSGFKLVSYFSSFIIIITNVVLLSG